MRNAQSRLRVTNPGCKASSRFSLFLCLGLLLPCSRAQGPLDGTRTAAGLLPTTSTLAAVTAFQTYSTGSIRLLTAQSTFVASSNTTTAPTVQATAQPPSDLFPAATSPHGVTTHNETVFNYYFLFLALFGVLVAALLWWLHRQRKRRKELMRIGGQEALARDLEGWAGTRRFMHGRYARNQHAAFVRRTEGLDEHGNAPPPYQPKSDMTMVRETPDTSHDAAERIPVPLGTLSRDPSNRSRPPAYLDTLSTHPSTSRGQDATSP